MEKQLITIDYLILNLEGKLQQYSKQNKDYDNINKFTFELAERGTKIFSSYYTVFYGDLRFGTLLCNPYTGSVLSPDFAQLQFDNALFYTHDLQELKAIFTEFLQETDYSFRAINRLDIALDKAKDYRQLAIDLINGKTILSGRKKKLTLYSETEQGQVTITGISVGERSSSKMLRIYNKTLYLSKTPKEYIDKWHADSGLQGEIWRFEYQLNAKFFTDLHQLSQIPGSMEKFNWGIFDIACLLELLQLAEKNHFELRENTGKSQINKEKAIIMNDWQHLKSCCLDVVASIIRVPKIIERSNVIKKRLAKSLFREYYVSKQDISFVLSLNRLLHENKMVEWFREKMKYYLAEFHVKEKIKDTFNFPLYWDEHSELFID
jgi:hypothetical protein